MSYNVEMTSGGGCSAKKQTGASMGQQADVAAEICRAVKNAISIPENMADANNENITI